MVLLERLLQKKQEKGQTGGEEIRGFDLRAMVERAIHKKLEEQPYFEDLQAFAENLMAMRGWWPVLLPSLALIGLQTYRAERRNIQHRQYSALRQQNEQGDETASKPKGKSQKAKAKKSLVKDAQAQPQEPQSAITQQPYPAADQQPQTIIAPNCRLSVVAHDGPEGQQRLTVVGHAVNNK